jgi:N-methylhydantoinase A/oxoprolinase/acetone carboxylase beta subunit
VDARYRGQSYELTVAADGWQAAFEEAHERRYGFRMESETELVNLRVVAVRARPRPRLRSEPVPPHAGSRRIFVDGAWLDAPLHGPGASVTGPAIVELPGATCLVRPGWAGEPTADGTLILERAWTP